MNFRIKEKFWAFGNDFEITDEHGTPVYFVDGKAFSIGDKLSFQDMKGNELAFISQKVLSLKPRYKITIGQTEFAEIIKEWSWIKKRFTLDVPGPNDYSIEGSFWEHEFQFIRSGKVVAQVSKDYWGWTDAYGVRIDENEDIVSILCTCIVIDQVLHDDESKRN